MARRRSERTRTAIDAFRQNVTVVLSKKKIMKIEQVEKTVGVSVWLLVL